MADAKRGKIVSVSWETRSPNQIAAAVAMRMPISAEKAIRFLESGSAIAADPALQDYGAIVDLPATFDDWRRFSASANAEDRIFPWLRTAPENTLNLSRSEFTRLRAWRASGSEDSPLSAMELLRQLLQDRYESYRHQGILGIEDYVRANRAISPMHDLYQMNAYFRDRLPVAYQPLISALDRFPSYAPESVQQHFYWKEGEIEKQPTFMLLHVLFYRLPSVFAYAVREYYVSGSYNCLQQVGVLIPDGAGVFLFLGDLTTTDRIVGFFNAVAQPIATVQLEKALEQHFDMLRTAASR